MAAIVKRGSKNKERFSVVYGYKDAGKRKQKWETYKTKKEAEIRLKELNFKMEQGTITVCPCKNLKELMDEFFSLYGKGKWALSTYENNTGLARNYIIPMIGTVKLKDINTRFLEKYYRKLLETPSVKNYSYRKEKSEESKVSTSTIRDIHKLLRCCLGQAVKWGLMPENPAVNATIPEHKSVEREIWTAETLMQAIELCRDDTLKLALHIAFSTTVRIGELAALTWDAMDISDEAIREGRAYVDINKEFQRVNKDTMEILNNKDILLVFPPESKLCKTVRVLKAPKTESSVRRVYLPSTVARLLISYREKQNEIKDIMGEEYEDYKLVFSNFHGLPVGSDGIRKPFKKFIKDNNLPEIDFHSLRHMSVTYKLKINGGDIKAVQGDSGHSQVKMVTDVYSHIIEEDRKKNAAIFEEAFYKKKSPDPGGNDNEEGKPLAIPEGVDRELLMKILSNPELAALLKTLAKGIQ